MVQPRLVRNVLQIKVVRVVQLTMSGYEIKIKLAFGGARCGLRVSVQVVHPRRDKWEGRWDTDQCGCLVSAIRAMSGYKIENE